MKVCSNQDAEFQSNLLNKKYTSEKKNLKFGIFDNKPLLWLVTITSLLYLLIAYLIFIYK